MLVTGPTFHAQKILRLTPFLIAADINANLLKLENKVDKY
jgi:hypothetical protein